MPAIPPSLLVPCSMKRVICHWSEGNYESNATDRAAYYLLVERDGKSIGGDHPISDNVSTADDDYAAHTKGANTASIGIACCAMVGCKETPFKPGAKPMKKLQWDAMVQAVAELCHFYKIPVTPTTVLGHGEVQANLGIKQNGKWDPMVWPWDTTKTRAQVGAALRSQVTLALAQLTGGGAPLSVAAAPSPPPSPSPVPAAGAAAAAPGTAPYVLQASLLAGDPEMRRIAATDAVLDPPLTSQRIPGIATVQEALNRIALNNPAIPRIDFGAGEKFRGFFGKQTVASIRAFQGFAGLGIDGVVGDDTLKALDAALMGGHAPGPAPALTAGTPPPAATFFDTLERVFNRGVPPVAFLQELVAWGRTAPDEIFIDKPAKPKETDVYASVVAELGPFGDLIHRKACMLEIMRVLAGFESSWKWPTGKDTNNPNENSADTDSAGAFQVSANSIGFGADLKALVAPHGILNAKKNGVEFQKLMKANHVVAMEYAARLIRHTRMHHGPLHKGKERNKFKAPLNKEEQSIYPWLSKDAVAEFQQLLA
ncbi:MAG: N-acetylmuramoyl-L-alanine amidase [Prosthecobacter sp.]